MTSRPNLTLGVGALMMAASACVYAPQPQPQLSQQPQIQPINQNENPFALNVTTDTACIQKNSAAIHDATLATIDASDHFSAYVQALLVPSTSDQEDVRVTVCFIKSAIQGFCSVADSDIDSTVTKAAADQFEVQHKKMPAAVHTGRVTIDIHCSVAVSPGQ